jgi:hypothetical protein
MPSASACRTGARTRSWAASPESVASDDARFGPRESCGPDIAVGAHVQVRMRDMVGW